MSRTERTLWPLAAAALLLLSGCDGPADRAQAAEMSGADHGRHLAEDPALAAGDAADHSLYRLPSSWRDRHGRAAALADLAGRAQVVAMVYTHCTFACPRILAQMKKVEAEVVAAGLEDRVGFTLVSLDPARDTPGRLDDFGRSLRLDEERWTLLTGPADDVRALSILLGVKYHVDADGGIDHSNLVTVLDPDGVPVHRIEGLSADTEPAVRAIRSLFR